jgi:integrase
MITIRAVEGMQPGETIWDSKLPGFGARRQLNAISYVLKFRLHGMQRFVTLGRHGVITPDEARRKARRMLGQAADGNDPIVPKSDAVGTIIEEYLTGWASKSQGAETRRHTEYYLRRLWRGLHHMPVSGVKRRDVARGLGEIEAAHSSVVAGRARTALSGMFSWAIREGYEIPANPVSGTNRPPEASRDRVLSEAELTAIWRAADGEFGVIVKLLILTAQRRDEIGKLRRGEIELSTGSPHIRLPGNRTKNHREHIVPLSPLAVALLPDCVVGRDWLFGVGDGFSGYSRGKAILDAASGVSGWRLHDLRRTAATMMADKLTILPHIIEAILNHVSGHRAGVAGIYNRARYLDEMRSALCAWAQYVEALA